MSEALNLPYDRLKQLQKKAYVNYEGMSLNDIFIRLPKMYKKGQENLEKDDESVAFVYFTRWLNAVKWIKSTDLKFYLQKIDNDQVR